MRFPVSSLVVRPERVALSVLSANLFAALFCAAPVANAQIVFSRTTFLADPRVGTTTSINFDTDSIGTNYTNQTVSGVTFGAPGTSPLSVISGATGVRFAMSPSSGANVLSPGGSGPSLEDDDLSLTFATAVQATGLDVVFDVPDGLSFVGVTYFDAANNVLASNSFIPSPNGAPGYQFVGYISNSANIKRVVFDDFDPSPNDDNIAYDSVVFTSPSVAPEASPAALLTLGGLVGGVVAVRRRAAAR